MTRFCFWMKMTTKLKPQGPRYKRFEFCTKVAKVTKAQGPFWQFTLILIGNDFCLLFHNFIYTL
ncbi:hypothetical protein Hanom_Chr02g00122351 [Helianthus anomalus]